MQLTNDQVKDRLWLPILIGLTLRLVNINGPILGIHSWRQADTAAMARHFYLEKTPIWLPQIDWGGANTGFVECEFPFYPYLLAQLYKVFGLHEWIGRSLSVLFSILTIIILINIGSRLLDPRSGWWGGIFFSFLPLSVYYGRTLQAESLLLLISALSIDKLIAWKENKRAIQLLLSWSLFCLACLIKVLPMIWLGIPLLMILIIPETNGRSLTTKELITKLKNSLHSALPWLLFGGTLLIGSLWYYYAYKLGQESNLSFGFWGKSSDRNSLNLLLDINNWLNLLLRISLRNMAFFGVPLVIITLLSCREKAGVQILFSGIIGVFLCSIISLRASSIHEYYQLPLQLFLCPLMGKGFTIISRQLTQNTAIKSLLFSGLAIMISISIIILSIDYWSIENRQSKVWMPLAKQIRQEVAMNELIVTITGSDPSLLNLGRRRGWSADISEVNQKNIQYWEKNGATYLAGNLDWQNLQTRLIDGKVKENILRVLCNYETQFCDSLSAKKHYLIKIDDFIR